MKMKIKISPDGKTITGLYSDQFPWHKLGKLEITRASDVFFDQRIQKWRVKLLHNFCVLPRQFKIREDAIAYEREYLESDDFAQTKKRFNERIRNLSCTEANFI